MPDRHKVERAESSVGQIATPQLQRVVLASERHTGAQLGIKRLPQRVRLVPVNLAHTTHMSVERQLLCPFATMKREGV